jgi:hypothetical protein
MAHRNEFNISEKQHAFQITLEISGRDNDINSPLSLSSDICNFSASAFLQHLGIPDKFQPKMTMISDKSNIISTPKEKQGFFTN